MPDDYFDQFQLPHQDEPPKPDAKPSAEEDRLAALQAELAALRTAQETERRNNQELMARMFAGTAAPQPQIPQRPQVAIDLNGLPDPRDDIEGYHRGLGERLGKTMEDMRSAVRQELTSEQAAMQEQNSMFDQAWSRFGERHEELASYPELVETATAQVFAELRRTGLEPMRLMQVNLDDLVDRVAERSQQFVDRIRGTQSEDESKPSGRTAMLDGASPKPRGRQQPESKPSDFLDSLKKLQSEMRIY